jgi:hypothetical protein
MGIRRRFLHHRGVKRTSTTAVHGSVFHFIELSTRKVELGGIGLAADGLWMSQIGRNLTDAVDGIWVGKRYLIHDRDPLFTAEIPEYAGRFRSEVGETATAIAELECLRRTLCPQHPRVLHRASDLVRRGLVVESGA